jgi:hypothetical protein
MQMKIDTFLENLGIAYHPGLRIERRLMGYENFTFGCRVTLCPSARHLAHELGHAAQFGPKHFARRARQYGFNFKMRTVEVADEVCDEPNTAHATVRELETFAFQAHLLELAGVRINHANHFKHAARIMTNHMPDWYCVPGESEAERFKWCVQKAKALYARARPDDVLARLKGWLDETAKHLATQQLAA